jgi:transcriptional regulator with XRE-family HTH domain
MAANILDQRRRELGITIPALAVRSGVTESTVKRILNQGMENASFGKVCAVAEALGVQLRLEPTVDAVSFQEREATYKAKRIIEMVQGSSSLEEQGVSGEDCDQMLRRTVHELMAGPKRRLWAT